MTIFFAIFSQSSRSYKIYLLAFLFLLCSSCVPPQSEAGSTPIVHTMIVSQIVTQDVTQEVTRVISNPVTVTPTETPEFTHTPSETPTFTTSPTITSTPEFPKLSILEYTNCLYGPGDFYLYKTSYPAGSRMEAVGRSFDYLWINIQDIHGWNACWVPANMVRLDSASTADLPYVYTALPLARYEYSAPTVKATRTGDEVVLTWKAVWMSRDELRGYLIEAWVCQDGDYIFLPVGLSPTYEENVDMLSLTVRDEAGCTQASSGRIATAVKKGYTLFEKIFWPPP